MKEGNETKIGKLVKRVAKIRVSKRTFPPRKCPQTGIEFIPTDKRQVYVSKQAQIDHNNDQRAIKQKELNEFTTRLKVNRDVLKKGFEKLEELKQNAIGKDILLFAGLDFSTYSSLEKNSRTGMLVYWSVDYGIEGLNNDNKTFIIHKRKK